MSRFWQQDAQNWAYAPQCGPCFTKVLKPHIETDIRRLRSPETHGSAVTGSESYQVSCHCPFLKIYLKYLHLIIYYVCVYTCVLMDAHVPWCVYGGQKTIGWIWLSPSTMLVSGMELRSFSLAADALPDQPSPRPSQESKYTFIINSNKNDLLLQDPDTQENKRLWIPHP